MATAEETPRRGRGRPPKKPGKGTRRNYAFRMSDQTRDRVVTAADEAGRSMSEEIERRVELSFQAEESSSIARSLLNGSNNLYVLISRISGLVGHIENYKNKSGEELGSKDWKSHEPTSAAIRAGVKQLVEDLTGPVRDIDYNAVAVRQKRVADSLRANGKITAEEKAELVECSYFDNIRHMELIGGLFAGILSGDISLDELTNVFKPIN